MKFVALFALALCFAKVPGFAGVNLGAEAKTTPYDPYLRSVKEVLAALPGESPSLNRVRGLMRHGRNFRYSYTDPYVAADPDVTATRKAGDCKAKSLWLCDRLGDRNVRYVIGKSRRNSPLSHAWVLWKHDGRWWILDCTNQTQPIAADSISPAEYIPLYSYDRTSAYCHTAEGETKRASVAAKNERSPREAKEGRSTRR
jgi:hypothetical protein